MCIGSVAMHMVDDMSDLDLYVLCEPVVLSEQQRRDLLSCIPGVSAIEIGVSSAGFDDEWVSTQDKVRIDNILCDIAYNTVGWFRTIVGHVLANGNDPLPQLPFRPYTLLGLLENSMVLFDRDCVIKDLTQSIRPYPSKLRTDLVSLGMMVLKEALEELQDYQKRGIGNAAFAFHLNRISDSLCMVLYALNESYDPATKRVEQSLKTLPKLPNDCMQRYEEVLSLPLDSLGRQRAIDQYELLIRDLSELCEAERVGWSE